MIDEKERGSRHSGWVLIKMHSSPLNYEAYWKEVAALLELDCYIRVVLGYRNICVANSSCQRNNLYSISTDEMSWTYVYMRIWDA